MSASSNANGSSGSRQCSRGLCSRPAANLVGRGGAADFFHHGLWAVIHVPRPSVVRCVLAGAEGFEPSHAGIKIQCLNQLGDAPTRVDDRGRQPIFLFSVRPALEGMSGQIVALTKLPTRRFFRQIRVMRHHCKHRAPGARHARLQTLVTEPFDGFGDRGTKPLRNRLQVVVTEAVGF